MGRTRDALGEAVYEAEFAVGRATPLDDLLRCGPGAAGDRDIGPE